jgi:putative hydrolase of the HAD superfamily
MRRTVLFIDFDGVIRHWNDDVANSEEHWGLPAGAIRSVVFSPTILLPAISGAIDDETWRRTIVAELQQRHPAARAYEAVAQWSLSPGEVDRETLALLTRCHPELRIVLATNATSRLNEDLHTLGLSSRFHAVANSSELRATKPSPEFFRAALALVGTAVSAAMFIDDSLQNVEAAAELGMLTHHFRGHVGMCEFLEQAGALATG